MGIRIYHHWRLSGISFLFDFMLFLNFNSFSEYDFFFFPSAWDCGQSGIGSWGDGGSSNRPASLGRNAYQSWWSSSTRLVF